VKKLLPIFIGMMLHVVQCAKMDLGRCQTGCERVTKLGVRRLQRSLDECERGVKMAVGLA